MNSACQMLVKIILAMPDQPETVPLSLRAVRDSLISGNHWAFWLFFLPPAAVLMASAWWWWWRQRRCEKRRRIVNDPEKLFAALLTQVKLAEDDRELLREVTKAARLRHPAMCLLSPQLLDLSRQAWLTEKNQKQTSEKSRRIETISRSLFDQLTPSGAQKMRESFSPLD